MDFFGQHEGTYVELLFLSGGRQDVVHAPWRTIFIVKERKMKKFVV